MYIVGLTGGIASGKSTVARILRELGAPVVDADLAARAVIPAVLPELVAAFGEGILRPGGSLDRGRLAAIVFADPAARVRLEAITHPPILRNLGRQLVRLQREGQAVAVLEVPLLVEAGLAALVDEIWVVAAGPGRQVERLALRDGLTPEQARQRLDAQLPLAQKREKAQVVIENNGPLAATRQQVEAGWARLTAARPRGAALARWTDWTGPGVDSGGKGRAV